MLQSNDVEEALNAQRAIMRGLELSPDTPMNHLLREQTQGVLFLDSLRRKMGDEAFLKLMNDYFAANTTKPVTAESFLEKAGVRYEPVAPPAGPAYLTSDIWRRLSSAVIVYGTVREAGANRYAAEQMQNHFLDRYESEVPIYKDFEASEELLQPSRCGLCGPSGGQLRAGFLVGETRPRLRRRRFQNRRKDTCQRTRSPDSRRGEPARSRSHGPGSCRQRRAQHSEGGKRTSCPPMSI